MNQRLDLSTLADKGLKWAGLTTPIRGSKTGRAPTNVVNRFINLRRRWWSGDVLSGAKAPLMNTPPSQRIYLPSGRKTTVGVNNILQCRTLIEIRIRLRRLIQADDLDVEQI